MFNNQIEALKTRLLGRSESIRLASKVQAVAATETSLAPMRVPLRKVLTLALTDRRLVVASSHRLRGEPNLVFEWPLGALRFQSVTPPLGVERVRVEVPGGGRIEFECLGGAPAGRWAQAHYRRAAWRA